PAHLIVSDALDAAGRHRYELRFHLSPGCRATTNGNRVQVTASDGRELILMTYVRSGDSPLLDVPARIEQGWVSRGYAHREPAPVAVMEVEARGAQRFTTTIVPLSEGYDIEEFLNRGLISGEVNTGR